MPQQLQPLVCLSCKMPNEKTNYTTSSETAPQPQRTQQYFMLPDANANFAGVNRLQKVFKSAWIIKFVLLCSHISLKAHPPKVNKGTQTYETGRTPSECKGHKKKQKKTRTLKWNTRVFICSKFCERLRVKREYNNLKTTTTERSTDAKGDHRKDKSHAPKILVLLFPTLPSTPLYKFKKKKINALKMSSTVNTICNCHITA